MSDLPDYQKYVRSVSGGVDVAEYDSDPEDLADGERGPILLDIKGRPYTLDDLIKIAGEAVATEVAGKLPITADIRKVIGYDIPPGYGAGVLPTYITMGVGYNSCLDAWQVILTSCGITLDVDVTDESTRLLGIIYGSQDQKIQQKALTYELLTYDSYVKALLGAGLPEALDTGALKIKEQSPLSALKIWDGTNYLATPGVGDAIARGLFLYGSDYGSPTPYARIVKVDSSGRLSCVLG